MTCQKVPVLTLYSFYHHCAPAYRSIIFIYVFYVTFDSCILCLMSYFYLLHFVGGRLRMKNLTVTVDSKELEVVFIFEVVVCRFELNCTN